MSKQTKILSLVVILVLLMNFIVYQAWPHAMQYQNLKLANNHAPLVASALHDDDRFSNVRVEQYTGHGGAIWTIASVTRKEHIVDLIGIVESTDPPVPVKYTVILGDDEQIGFTTIN